MILLLLIGYRLFSNFKVNFFNQAAQTREDKARLFLYRFVHLCIMRKPEASGFSKRQGWPRRNGERGSKLGTDGGSTPRPATKQYADGKVDG